MPEPIASDRVKPAPHPPIETDLNSHIGQREAFLGIVGRNTADYLMQSAQRHHVRLSQMADTKANMLLTVSTVVLTLSLAQMKDVTLRPALMTLCFFTLMSLFMAILTVLPKVKPLKPIRTGEPLPEWFNPMFFGHFSAISRDRYFKLMGDSLRSDPAVYETLVNDLYGLGMYLGQQKYRYLRLAYMFLLAGFVIACAQVGFEYAVH